MLQYTLVGSSASAKVAVTSVHAPTPTDPSAGVTEVTVGGVESIGPAVTVRHPVHVAAGCPGLETETSRVPVGAPAATATLTVRDVGVR